MLRGLTKLVCSLALLCVACAAFSSAEAQVIQVYSHNVVTSVANVVGEDPVELFSVNVTMPLLGCPCRVRADYMTVILASQACGGVGQTWIDDGLGNNFAQQIGGVPTATSGSLFVLQNSELSPSTYSNGQQVTFYQFLQAPCASGLWSVQTTYNLFGQAFSQEPSYFDLSVYTSL